MTPHAQDLILGTVVLAAALVIVAFPVAARIAAWRQMRAWCREVDATIEQANTWASETPIFDQTAADHDLIFLPGETIKQGLEVMAAMSTLDDELATLLGGGAA